MKLRLSLSLFVSISSLKKGTPSGPEAPAVTEGVCAGGFLFVLEGVCLCWRVFVLERVCAGGCLC